MVLSTIALAYPSILIHEFVINARVALLAPSAELFHIGITTMSVVRMTLVSHMSCLLGARVGGTRFV